jgi:arylsulfatase A-like enzyme
MKNFLYFLIVMVCNTVAIQIIADAAHPNVILIMTDDQGYGDVACHGNPVIKTPCIDQLHAESLRLTNFHVSPYCTPTRAALMTGRYPARTGAYRTSSGRTMLHRY